MTTMFSSSDDIHFSCNQCGKCCSKPPQVSFYDMLELSDKFIFQMAHHTVLSPAAKPLDKDLCEHYQIIGHTIMMPELEASLFYFVDFIPVTLPTYKSCPQLKDNKCQIYAQRPSSCRLSPFSAFYDEQQQWRTINFFHKQVKENGWQCSFDEKSALVYKDKDLYVPAQSALYHQEVMNIRDITDKYIAFMDLQKKGDKNEPLNDHFKTLFNAMSKNALVVTDVVVMLQAARYFNIISESVATDFIRRQLQLLKAELAHSVELKKKENLVASRHYKRMIEDYEKVLKQEIFRQDYSDEFSLIQ